MSLENIVENSYGQVFQATFKQSGTAQNISSYTTTQEFIFMTPSGTAKTIAASFTSDGTDGKIQFTIGSADFNEAGAWTVQGHVTSNSKALYTKAKRFRVHEKIT